MNEDTVLFRVVAAIFLVSGAAGAFAEAHDARTARHHSDRGCSVTTPYRTSLVSIASRSRWWHRLKCRFGAHEFIGPPRTWVLGEYMPCAHCAAKLTRVAGLVDGRAFFSITETSLQ